MTRTRAAGCLVLALGGIAAPANAEFACPGSVQVSPGAPPPVLIVDPRDRALDTPVDLHRYRVFGSPDSSAGPCFQPIHFRVADPAEAVARHLPETGSAMVNITFSPGPAPGAHQRAALIGRAIPGDGLLPTGDLALARMPGTSVVLGGLLSAPLPAGDARDDKLDVPTLVASIAGVGMAISLISAAMMKLPR